MTMKILFSCVLLALTRAIFGAWDKQAVFNVAENVAPLELLAISSEHFSQFSHPEIQGLSARIKKSQFCDGGVDSYTGYIDAGTRHLFFYFFESRNDPGNDDVLLWTNGGPGGSSSLGLFMELGPCNIAGPNSTKYNPHSWNSNANIFFIDQPVGTGFSYTDFGETVGSTEEGAKDVAKFMALFFETFSKFKGRPFHLTGESYAGRYLPLFGAAIYDQNAELQSKGLTPVNLKSVAIGNGATDFFALLRSYYDVQCTNASIEPIQSIDECIQMRLALPRCEKMQKHSCVDHFDHMDCEAAFGFCFNALAMPYHRLENLNTYASSGRNPYDMTLRCAENHDVDCYPEQPDIETFLSQKWVQKEIGVDPSFGNFSSISMNVNFAFWASGDPLYQNSHYLAELLERGVRVLIYAGTYDWIANWVGNERWTREMVWSGQAGYVKEELVDWSVDGHVAGKVRSYGNFTFATIYGAGHLVLLSGLLVASLSVAALAFADQTVFSVVENVGPLELSSIQSESFTRFSHPEIRDVSARIKKSKFCDGGVDTYTGYIDAGTRHLFFYFFESRNDPDSDDVLLWTNGGPGASSSMGLFMELGPCTIAGPNSTKFNPNSWSSNANIFFIDQPVSTGFSYADFGEAVVSTTDGAKDIARFVALFFETFPKFKGRPFHLTGESYVYDQNAELIAKGLTPVNLRSVAIGESSVLRSYYDVQCTGASIEPYQTRLPRCEKFTKEACIDSFDLMNCAAAFQFCSNAFSAPYRDLVRNAYDMTMRCHTNVDCYPDQDDLQIFLNQDWVREEIGVDSSVGNFTWSSSSVNSGFWASGDPLYQNSHYVAELLERGVRVLIYAGTNDWIANWVGNERWTLEMWWSGQEGYVSKPLIDWSVEGKVAGKVRSYGNLTFATIYDAGHLVPRDKPVEALAMINRWLNEEEL
ncbi:alpha/beta-hydrolase [Schizopora paradoxa]|uniref:Carboxypeptidase n=1 Tax=Schizopora paradoxa TaxID=27342 RepID=A0A0H2RUP6_9AGAM|nr:alpha/beta-hydrolase [Schizopora paradoxa]